MTFIAEIKQYIREDGMRLTQFINVAGEPPEDFAEYSHEVQVPIGLSAQGQQMMTKGTMFFNALSIDRAFEYIDSHIQDFARNLVDQAQKEMTKKRLVMPGELPHHGNGTRPTFKLSE